MKGDYTIHGYGYPKDRSGTVCFSKIVRVEYEARDSEETIKTKAIAHFFDLMRRNETVLDYHSLAVVAVSWGRRNQGDDWALCSPVTPSDCREGVWWAAPGESEHAPRKTMRINLAGLGDAEA